LSAVPEFGRAAHVEPSAAPEAAATQDLYRRFSGQIYGYCLHQLGSREEAEDAVQTTFMNVFRGLRSGIVPRVEGAWLFKIAHNVCLSRRRSTRRRGRVESPNNFEVLQEVVPARERSTDELIRLHDALETMPETQRRAILLREWQGLSYREIAEELQISQAAVETLIFRARRALAAGLQAPAEDSSLAKRARYSIDASGLVAAAKTLLGSGSSVKLAAAVAALATTAVATSELPEQRDAVKQHPAVVAAKVVHAAPLRSVESPHGGSPMAHRVVARGGTATYVALPTRAHVSVHAQSTVTHASLAPPEPARIPHSKPSHETHANPASPAKPVTPVKNGHAYGHAKHADKAAKAHTPEPVPPVSTPAAQGADTAPPASAPPVEVPGNGTPPESPGKSDEPHGNGH
jgi:RNA polymerase sigma factor (sigma-70 family)